MKTLTSREMLDAMDAALAEADRKLALGELDQSGRFWTDGAWGLMKEAAR